MPLHIDYRPMSLDELIGNDSIKDSLQTIFARKDRPHAFLFHGPSGCGKTTIARIIASMLECSELDTHEYNSSNTRGIDTIREIAQNVHYTGQASRIKIYILDEVHQLTKDASHALLKTLEDTPKHVYFVLCTTEPEKLLKTIHTRCTTYQVKLLTDAQIKKLINRVLEAEKVTDFPSKLTDEITRVVEGCPRQALVLLDQIIDIVDEKKAMEAISFFTVGEAEVIEICRGLMQKKAWSYMKDKVSLVLSNTEPEKVRMAILGYLTAVLLDKNNFSKASDYARASALIILFSDNTYNTGKAGIVNAIFTACS